MAEFNLDPSARGPESVAEWFSERRRTEGAEGLWRVHETLYDLTDFVNKHPGGSFWLSTTRGTDITEAVETHLNSDKVSQILKKYAVRKAKSPSCRFSTFEPNGFYCTVRRRAFEVLQKLPSGPTVYTCTLVDVSAVSFLFLSVISALWSSYLAAILAGVVLALTLGAAHNQFHQRDTFRVYYFDLGMLSSRYWRVSHALSHHLYPNTLKDLEVSEFSPYLIFLPFQTRNWVQYHASRFYAPLLNALIMPIVFVKKIGRYFTGDDKPHPEDVLVWLHLILFVSLTESPTRGLILWFLTHSACSWFFMTVSLVAGTHHNDKIWHQGDKLQERDFGLMQIEATRDRHHTVSNALAVFTFGDHVLHHLFPLVDAAHLQVLYPCFIKTCREFGVETDVLIISPLDAARGFFRQLQRTVPNSQSTVLTKKSL